jgi:hypothetical protein
MTAEGEEFALGTFRIGCRAVNVEVSIHTVGADVNVKLHRTGGHGRGGFWIRADGEGRVFFCKLARVNPHHRGVGFGLRFDGIRHSRVPGRPPS